MLLLNHCLQNVWVMTQTWRNVLFIHWPISPTMLRPLIPACLDIDTFQGNAWIGVVVFHMEGIYPRGWKHWSVTPSFPEINVRTYVTYHDEPGVYFLSLDVNNWASLHIAKRWYHLPYYRANISLTEREEGFHFEGVRYHRSFSMKGTYTPTGESFYAYPGTLTHFLTERYTLYSSDWRGNVYHARIAHSPWRLQTSDLFLNQNSLFSFYSWTPLREKGLVHFSPGVDTRVFPIQKIHENTFV